MSGGNGLSISLICWDNCSKWRTSMGAGSCLACSRYRTPRHNARRSGEAPNERKERSLGSNRGRLQGDKALALPFDTPRQIEFQEGNLHGLDVKARLAGDGVSGDGRGP